MAGLLSNRLFVALADKTMRREGRMIAALDSMGVEQKSI
jgi:hypothetical protein